jgi:hypothetical protein
MMDFDGVPISERVSTTIRTWMLAARHQKGKSCEGRNQSSSHGRRSDAQGRYPDGTPAAEGKAFAEERANLYARTHHERI